jgi:hypothetical protein
MQMKLYFSYLTAKTYHSLGIFLLFAKKITKNINIDFLYAIVDLCLFASINHIHIYHDIKRREMYYVLVTLKYTH